MQQTLNVDGTVVKMHIWDTGGSDRFRSLVSMYYRDAIAAIICYDVTNEISFKSVDYWTNEMKQKNNMSNFIFSLSANKCDMPKEEWQITDEMNNEFCAQQNLVEGPGFIKAKTSSKTGEGIREMFQKIAKQIVQIKLNE